MKIKYLKDAPQAKAGDIKELENTVANVLILTGYAEESAEDAEESVEENAEEHIEEKPTATKKKTTKKTTAK